MKTYAKECKDTKEVNKFLKLHNLSDWMFDEDYDFHAQYSDFEFDNWLDEENEKNGLDLMVTKNYEVFITRYEKKDLEKLEKEYA